MQVKQPNAKLFIEGSSLSPADYIPIFHRWIQHKRTDELLIDVHNYSHVPDGPGILLIAHESYHSIDSAGGRSGLLYRVRRGEPAEAAAGLRKALQSAVSACQLLEQDSKGAVTFSGSRIRLGFDDRLRAPNDAATHAALTPAIEALAAELFDGEVRIEQAPDPRASYCAEIISAQQRPLAELAARLGLPAGASN